MPVPNFDHNGVLPPHIGNHAANSNCMSPYLCTSSELCTKLGATQERKTILLGFFALRDALRQLGVTQGFQWVDGSFTEDAEHTRGLSPNDIDVVTFYVPASPSPGVASTLLPVIRNRTATKQQYHVDHILVPLASTPNRIADAHRLVDETRYWFGLFSHRRSDDVWKGMLRLDLNTEIEDAQAIAAIQQGVP